MRFALSFVFALSLVGAVLCKEDANGQQYVVPEGAAFTVEDVTIQRVVASDADKPASFEIAGALRVPSTERPPEGFPGVLFISGSGSQKKHGIQRGMDLGSWELLDAIAEAGFVVLSTDDRGIGGTPLGQEGLASHDIGYDEFVGDARAALHYLASRGEVNTGSVFIVGHSEGGITAPILAGEFEVAGIVFMAAPGRNMYDVILEQVGAAMASQPESMRARNLKAQREFQDAAKEAREPDFNILGKAAAPNLEAVWQRQVVPIRAWWHDHFNLDVPAIHQAVSCPCFVAQGKRDFQVKPEADAARIAKSLIDGNCTDVKFKVYDDLDHLFKPCDGRESNREMYFEDRRVCADFIDDVVEWLKARHR